VPPEIAVFSCLKDLDLDENNISILPPEMGQLSCLEMLLVRGNGLKEIDEAVFEGMTNLKVC
jgi:Leucine-rich repeat (LRR) protein